MADGSIYNYDILIIATGAKIAPEEIDGMKAEEWQKVMSLIFTLLKVLWP